MFKSKKKKAEAEAAAAAAAAEAGAEDAAPAAEAEASGEDAEAGEGGEADAPAKKKAPLKLILIAAAALLVIGGSGGTAWFMFFKAPAPAEGHETKPKKKKKAEKGEHATGEAAKGAGLVREGPDGVTYYTMPDIVVNMQTTTGRPANLRLKLTFETKEEEAIESMEPNLPRLNDTLETFLRELRPEDLAGSQGSYALRMEIERRVNLVIAPSKIDAVRIEDQLIN